MRSATRGCLQRLGHHRLHGVVGDLASDTGPRLVMQPIKALRDEPGTPLADAAAIAAKLTRDILIRLPVRTSQNDLRPERHVSSASWPRREPLQRRAFVNGENQDLDLWSTGARHPIAWITPQEFCRSFSDTGH